MIRLFTYDVAISFAEEDVKVANLIAAALKKRDVRYYHYKERKAGDWGKHLIRITLGSYGKRSRFILMIISRDFAVKYWSDLERQMVFASRGRILPLRLDNTEVDGVTKHLVFHTWNNDAEEIADLLQEKINTHKVFERGLGKLMAALVMIFWIVLICVFLGPGNGPGPEWRKELIMSTTDSFYISNSEVTIAEYRKFCDEQKIAMPPQLPLANENGPVVNVTWYEALAYCKLAHGRLPTEAEWEYAASAGLSIKYSGGNAANKVAIYNKKKPNYVRSKDRNTFGLYDMTGNAAEWCADSLAEGRPVRGGAYNSKISPVNELAIAYRTHELPDVRKPYIGFRVVWDIKN